MGCGCKARREKLARLNTRVGRWLAKKLGKPVDQEVAREEQGLREVPGALPDEQVEEDQPGPAGTGATLP